MRHGSYVSRRASPADIALCTPALMPAKFVIQRCGFFPHIHKSIVDISASIDMALVIQSLNHHSILLYSTVNETHYC